jgi:hypothetical protein
MRSPVEALAGGRPDTIAIEEIIDRRSEDRGLPPGPAEGDDASAIDEVDGRSEAQVRTLRLPVQRVGEHQPRDVLLGLVIPRFRDLLVIRVVGPMSLPRMCLPDEHLDEGHPIAVELMELRHRRDAASGHRAGVADEMQEHRPPSEIPQPDARALGRMQLEVRCLGSRRQASTEQLSNHVSHPEVSEIEIVDRVELMDQPFDPVPTLLADG